MNESEFAGILDEALSEFQEHDSAVDGLRVSSFDEAGVLTMNEGLVIRLQDGSEFQVTIVQSRTGEDEMEEREAILREENAVAEAEESALDQLAGMLENER